MSLESFFGSLVGKIAVDLTRKLLDAAALAVRRKFDDRSASRKALEETVRKALGQALESVETPRSLEEYGEDGKEHLRGLLEEFLDSDDVVATLANLVDPRPDTELDFAALVASLDAQGFKRAHFPDLDLARFLDTFAREFYALAAEHVDLRELLKVRLLGQLLGEATRTARAAEEIAAHTGFMASEVAELRKLAQARDGSERRLLQVVQVFVGGGTLPALQGYETLVEALGDQGLALSLDPSGETLEIEGGTLGDEKALPPARRNVLESAAMELRRAVVGHRPTEDELPALEERYRRHLVRWFGNLTFQGMMRAPRPIVLPLEKVYVELRSVAEVPEAADAFSVDERRLLLELEDDDGHVDRDKQRELMSQLDALRRERWSRTLPDRRSIAEALHGPGQRAFVILGDPGSGKTTLLHYLALVYARGRAAAAERLGIPASEADRLPIFVPLATFDDLRRRRGENAGLTLREFLPLYYDTRRGLPGLGALFERAIASGRALVLLDGLDEVIDVQTRRFVAEQVSALMGEWTPRGVRFVLSSRVVGYREAPVSGKVSTLTVLDFGEREIRTFVRQWSQAYEVWAAGEETPEVLRQARARESDLMEDVVSNSSVRRLAANPLMLTMLALLRRQTGIRLPHRRIELYESYVKTLLENWVYTRSLDAREQSLDLLDRHQAENVLIPLALWLQEEKPSGTAGQVEIHRKLTTICLEEEGLTRETADRKQVREAEAKATRFLREMREMSGLIVERGHDAFGFLHLTFQEYFAGWALAQKGGAERWAIIRGHLHDPRWREPLMLCAGRLGVVENRRPEVSELVRSILDCDDPTEGDLHRHLLLALAIACDDVYLDPQLLERLVVAAVECLPTEVYALGRAIMGFLGQLAVNGATSVERCFEPVLECEDERTWRTAIEILGRFGSEVGARKILLDRLSDKSGSVVAATIQALSSQVENHEDIRNALIERLNDDHSSVRDAAVSALASSVDSDVDIRNELIKKLNDDDDSVRQSATSALASRVKSDEDIRNVLIERLNDDGWFVRDAAARALSSSVDSDEDIRNALFDKLNSDLFFDRFVAARALASSIDSDVNIRNALIDKLNDDAVCRVAASALASRVDIDVNIRNVLIDKLNDDSPSVRQAAVSALASRVDCDESIRNALIDKLNDGDRHARMASLRGLGRFLLTHSEIFAACREQRHDDNWEVRQTITEVVGKSGSDEQHFQLIHEILTDVTSMESSQGLASCQAALSELTHANAHIFNQARRHIQSSCWRIRQVAIIALASHVDSDQDAKNILIDKLYNDVYPVRQAAVSALASRVDSDQDIQNILIDKLKDDSYSVRQATVNALASRVDSDQDIQNILIDKLKDNSYSVRQATVNALASRVDSDQDIRNILIDKLKDNDYHVREAVVSALASRVDSDEHIRIALIDKLKDNDYHVRQAAVSALASRVDSDERIRNAFIDKLDDDIYAIRQAAASALASCVDSDEHIRNALISNVYFRQVTVSALADRVDSDEHSRNALIDKLNDDHYYVRQSAVSALASRVDTDEHIRNALQRKLVNDVFPVRLKIVEEWSVRPRDPDLEREVGLNLLSWLSVDARSGHPYYFDGNWPWQVQKKIAERLGKGLPHDPDLQKQILDLLSESRWSSRLGAVLTLLAWPGGPPEEVVDRMVQTLDDLRGLESYPARLTAASFLVNRNEYCAEAIEVCLEALDYGTRPWEFLPEISPNIRKQAALVLGKLEPLYYDERVYEKLLGVLKEDEDGDVRDAAYHALVRLASKAVTRSVILGQPAGRGRSRSTGQGDEAPETRRPADHRVRPPGHHVRRPDHQNHQDRHRRDRRRPDRRSHRESRRLDAPAWANRGGSRSAGPPPRRAPRARRRSPPRGSGARRPSARRSCRRPRRRPRARRPRCDPARGRRARGPRIPRASRRPPRASPRDRASGALPDRRRRAARSDNGRRSWPPRRPWGRATR